MNVQFYWDGNVGVCEYDVKRKFFKTKPSIPNVSYDVLVYDQTDSVAFKILNKVTTNLTENEISVVKAFCEANADEEVISGGHSIEEHNADTTAHHDIRVQLSNLHEFAHKVATVWTTEVSLKETSNTPISLSWKYVINDTIDCTNSDATYWKCPISESYDFRVRMGFTGVDTTDNVVVTLALKKKVGDTITTILEGSEVVSKNSIGLPCVQLEADNINLNAGDLVYVEVTLDTNTGLVVPSRSFLAVDNHGATMAKRQADFFFNTLGNMVFFKGYELSLMGDSSGTPQVVANKWNPEVTEVS